MPNLEVGGRDVVCVPEIEADRRIIVGMLDLIGVPRHYPRAGVRWRSGTSLAFRSSSAGLSSRPASGRSLACQSSSAPWSRRPASGTLGA